MGDTENSLPPSKKRAAGREISRDNPGLDDDEEETSEQEMGTFKKASDEVIASRRIVKVRRNQTSSTTSAPSSNPFAGIRLVPPLGSAATTASVTDENENSENQAENEGKVDASKEINQGSAEKDKQLESRNDEPKDESTAGNDKNDIKEEPNKPESTDDKGNDENSESKPEEGAEPVNSDKGAEKDPEAQKDEGDVKKDDGNGSVEKGGEAASFNSFQQLSSSQNAFTGLAGTGFSGSTFSFGSITEERSPGSGSGSIFGLKSDQPSFSFGLSNNGSSSLFGTSGTSTTTKSEGSGFTSMQEVPLETGEENEKPAFTADSVLFEYIDGSWKERGKGEIKVNIPTTGTGKARLIMRTRGNFRLILNASLFPDMKLTNMDKRGITFACVNSIEEGKDGLSTFALKFKDAFMVGEFRACVMEHKGKLQVDLKTPENSPKTSDE